MTMNVEDLRFLVIDDNDNICRVVKAILQTFGAAHVERYSDANAALAYYHQQKQFHPVDVIIVDHNMRPMNGTELISAV